ncbi:MAG: HEAT repeat domain-containing protein, partial [Planctomycetota bacterium]
ETLQTVAVEYSGDRGIMALGQLEGLDRRRALAAAAAIAGHSERDQQARLDAIDLLATHLTLHSPEMRDLMRLVADEDPTIRAAATTALGTLRDRPTALALYSEAASRNVTRSVARLQETVAARQQQELEILEEMDGSGPAQTPVQRALKALQEGTPAQRAAAAWDLRHFSDRRVVPALLAALGAPDAALRAAAADSLVHLSDQQAVPGAQLLALLEHAETGVRRTAATLIARLQLPGATQALQAAALREEDPDTAATITTALDSLGDATADRE